MIDWSPQGDERVLALGLDPALADLKVMPRPTPPTIRAYIDARLKRPSDLGYEVESWLLDLDESAEAVVLQRLPRRGSWRAKRGE